MTRITGMLALVAIGASIATAPALADTKVKKIAFSNNYAGNSWRQAMLKSYDIVTKKAVADGAVAAADVFTTADKEVPTQAAQIQNLILQGYDAIVINASSPDALNGAIKQACDAGIVVVSFDGIVTEPCAWRVVVDYKDMGLQEVEHMAKFQPKGGNLLEIRGLAGTSIDDAIHAGILEGVAAHPEFKIVASVEGDWDQTTAQKAVTTVIPSLPDIVSSSASSINDAGWAVGTALVRGQGLRGFAYDGTASFDLNDALSAADQKRWRISSAVSVGSRSSTSSSETCMPPSPLLASSDVAHEMPAAPRSWMPSTRSPANSSRQHSMSTFSANGSPTCTAGRLVGPPSLKVSEARMEAPPMPSPPVRAPNSTTLLPTPRAFARCRSS